MTFGLAWWLRPHERADIGTPFFIVLQASLAAPTLGQGFSRPSGPSAVTIVVGGLFALLALRNCLRLLRPRPVPTTAMVVSLVVCTLYLGLLAASPIVETNEPLSGLLLLPPVGVLLGALAQESVRKVNLKQA